MLYTIYKITNVVNGKFYIGKHQTLNPEDGYLGSGKYLRAAIRKHGRSNFTKEVLFIFETEQEMNAKEREIVTEDLVRDQQCYNACPGGEGGPLFKGRRHSEETKAKLRAISSGKTQTAETRRRISENNWARKDPQAHRLLMREIARIAGRGRTDEHNAKISTSLKSYYSNGGHPHLGKKWEKVQCPHCGKCGGKNAMTRYHFENCKEKSV